MVKKDKVLRVYMPEETLLALTAMAESCGLSTPSLVRMWITEKLKGNEYGKVS